MATRMATTTAIPTMHNTILRFNQLFFIPAALLISSLRITKYYSPLFTFFQADSLLYLKTDCEFFDIILRLFLLKFHLMAETDSSYSKHVDELFAGGRQRTYPKNQLIHYQGDPLSHIYLVRNGYIKAYTILDSGDTRTILLLGPGDIFPLSFSSSMVWTNYTIRYFYQTLCDTEVSVLPSDILKDKIDGDPEMLGTYMTYLSASNEAIMTQLEVMKNKKAIDKVEMLLPYLISKAGKRIRPDIYELQLKMSHQEIADLSGVTRETTTTLIKELENRGVIDQGHGRWTINTKKLAADTGQKL